MTAFLHTELLDSLKQRVKERSEKHRAYMAKGVPADKYWEMVGRDKECQDLINAINEMAENNDEDKDESKGNGSGRDGPRERTAGV